MYTSLCQPGWYRSLNRLKPGRIPIRIKTTLSRPLKDSTSLGFSRPLMAIEVKKDNPHEVTVGTENLQLCWRLLPLLPSTRQALWGSRTQQPAGCSAVHCQPLLEAHAGA